MSEKLSSSIGMNTDDFKTGVAQLNRELRVVRSEFSATASTFTDWTKDIDGLEARTKSLNAQIEIQGQKVNATRAQYERMVLAHGADSRAAQEAQAKYNNETATLNKLNTELDTTEKSMDELKHSSDKTGESVQESSHKMEDFKHVIGGVGTAVKASIGVLIGLVAMLVTVGAAVGGLVFGVAKAADELNTLSDQTGISTQRLQEMKFAGEILGTSLDTITGSQAKLVRSMAAARDGTGAQADAFKRLGVSVKDARGNLRDTQAVFGDAIDALGKISNPAERDAAAMDIFGKSAQELNPLIKVGSKGMQDLAKQAHDVGAVMDDETVQAAANFQDQLDSLKLGLQGVGGTIAGAFLPAFSGIAGQAQGYLKEVADVVKKYGGSIRDTVDPITHQLVKGRSGPDLAGMAAGIAGIFTKIAKDVAAQAPKMLQAGLDIVKSVLGSITGALPTLLPAAIGILTSLIDFIVQSLPSLIDAGFQIVLALVNAILPALPKVVDAALNIIVSLANGLTDALPKLLPTVATVIVQVVETLVKNAPLLIKAALKLLTALAVGLTSAIKILGPAAPVILKALIDGLLKNRTELAFAAGEMIGALASFFVAESDQLVQAMIALIKIMSEKLPPDLLQEVGATLIAGFLTGINNGSSQAAQALQAQFQKEWTAGLAGWKNFFAGLGRTISQYFSDSNAGWKNFFGGLGNVFSNGFSDLVSGWGKFLGNITSLAAGIGSNLYNIGNDIIDNMWAGVQARWQEMLKDFQSLVDNLPDFIKIILGFPITPPKKTGGQSVGAEFFGSGLLADMQQAQKEMRQALNGFGADKSGAGAPNVSNSSTDNSLKLQAGTIIFQGPQTQGSIGAAARQKAKRF